jgi:hypothetical protein
LTRLDLHPITPPGETSFDDICVTIIIVPERKVYNNNRNSNKIFSRKSVCAFVCVSDFLIQHRISSWNRDAGDGCSSAYHDCAAAAADDDAATDGDDDDTAITRLTRHIRVFGTTELL